MFRDGGVVGAEELLNLDACQAAILSSLPQPRHSLRAQQSTGSECKREHLTTTAQSQRGMQEIPESKWTGTAKLEDQHFKKEISKCS